MKKPKKSTIVNKNDKLFSQIIRSRGQCERCGSADSSKLQCAHIFSRKYKTVRWDVENALCLCSGCHWWNHLNPAEYGIWVAEKWPERIKGLRVKLNKAKSMSSLDYLRIQEKLCKALKN